MVGNLSYLPFDTFLLAKNYLKNYNFKEEILWSPVAWFMPNDCMPKDSMPKDIMPNSSMPKRDYAKKQYATRGYAKWKYAKRGLCQKAVCQMTACQNTLCQKTVCQMTVCHFTAQPRKVCLSKCVSVCPSVPVLSHPKKVTETDNFAKQSYQMYIKVNKIRFRVLSLSAL